MNFYVIIRGYEFPTLTVISYYTSSILLYRLTMNSYRKLNFHECHMVIFQVMLTMPTNFEARSALMRLIYVPAAICCQILNVTVIAYYTMFFISPARWSQATNIKEMTEYKFQLSGEQYALSYLRLKNLVRADARHTVTILFQHIHKWIRSFSQYSATFLDGYRVCDNIDSCLDQLKWNDKLAISVSHQHARNYPPMPFTEMTCFDQFEAIHTYFISMLVWKDHPALLDVITLTNRAFEGGLIVKWARDIQFNPKQETALKLVAFQLDHLGASILCFIVCLCFSVMAFFGEILTFRKVNEPNPHKFWIFGDYLINNDRVFLHGSEDRTYRILYVKF